MPEQAGPRWSRIRRDYERDREGIAALCARYGVSQSALYRRARAEDWRKRVERRRLSRMPGGRRTLMIDQLYRIVEQEVQMIERALAPPGRRGDGAGPAFAERERQLRALNSVMRTLDRLIQVDARTRADNPREDKQEIDNFTEADAQHLRTDLARRLAGLRESAEPCETP